MDYVFVMTLYYNDYDSLDLGVAATLDRATSHCISHAKEYQYTCAARKVHRRGKSWEIERDCGDSYIISKVPVLK